jgi:enterochelin esterase-like enzyme
MSHISFKFILVVSVIIFNFQKIAGQTGGAINEKKEIKSITLQKPVKYAIYLPPDYSTSSRDYPVVYLLHGFSDDHTAWSQYGDIKRYADKGIADGTLPPMIIVLPDGFYSWYCNSYDGKEKYEDFFIKEFIPFIDTTYHVKKQKQFRGIAGLSMGGFGSLLYSIKYPQLFSAAAPLSAGVLTDDEVIDYGDKLWEAYFGSVIGPGLKGKNRLTQTWNNNSILQLISQKTKEELSTVRYWIDCADDDDFIRGNSYLHLALNDKGVSNEFRVRDGVHNWSYWRDGIMDALQFIGKSFRP